MRGFRTLTSVKMPDDAPQGQTAALGRIGDEGRAICWFLRTSKMSIQHALAIWAVSVVLMGCDEPAQADRESPPLAHAVDGVSRTDSGLATEFFRLVDEGSCGAGCPEHNAQMAAALDKLLPIDDAKPSLRRRLFSGPEPKGESSKLGAQDVWIYKACQAHQCSTTNMVVVYYERDQRMVARLQSQCELSWLGKL